MASATRPMVKSQARVEIALITTAISISSS
jgi:hypothetical protein